MQLTLTASFVPPLPPLEARRPPSLQMTRSNPDMATTPNRGALAPPRTPNEPPTPDGEAHLPPVTPNPFPAMNEGEGQYARVEGVTIWEGAVEEVGKRMVLRRDRSWEVVWRGEVPIGMPSLATG